MNELQHDVQNILSFHPPHISLYGLTYEIGTAFHKAKERGKLKPINDDMWHLQFKYIMETLREKGYEQYEISNFAMPGHRSIHNEQIWRNGFYGGLGPGAHGYLPTQQRTFQYAKWDSWIASEAPNIEKVAEEQQVIDAIITWIRHIEGIDMRKLEKKGFTIESSVLALLAKQDVIYVDEQRQRIYLKKNGYFIADGITKKLAESVRKLDKG